MLIKSKMQFLNQFDKTIKIEKRLNKSYTETILILADVF